MPNPAKLKTLLCISMGSPSISQEFAEEKTNLPCIGSASQFVLLWYLRSNATVKTVAVRGSSEVIKKQQANIRKLMLACCETNDVEAKSLTHFTEVVGNNLVDHRSVT